MSSIDINYSDKHNIDTQPDCIEINIYGLKSLNKFIGLEDTPLYYDNGKFFKVENNQIVYTDITWQDIKGNIQDNPEIIEVVNKLIEEQSKTIVVKIVDEQIFAHNNNSEAHPYIQNIIQDNYNTLNDKIDLNKFNTDENIKKVNERVDKNDEQIEDLQSFTNTLRSDLDDLTVEVQIDVKNSITQLDEKVDGININLTKQIDDLEQDVNDKYNELVRDIDDLTDVVEEDFTNVNKRIDNEITARTEADKTINEKINVIETDIANIETDIDNLEDRIDTVEDNSVVKIDYNANVIGITVTYGDEETEDVLFTNLATDAELQAEVTARTQADTQLNTKIDTTAQTINTRITNVADELNQTIEENVTALQQEDTALQNQINTHSQTLTAHDTRITNNTNAITKEIGDRQSADENLQEQIDGITAGADVRDIVGTYAQLQAYDKSKLGDNDIIKVLQDETKENASTYYRFSTSTQSFTYIGKEGPFYTKSETDGLLNVKANDSDVVHKTGNETINGIKIFSNAGYGYGGVTVNNTDGGASTVKFMSDGIKKGLIGVDASEKPIFEDGTSGIHNLVRSTRNTPVGSTTKPVYVNSNGIAQPITSYEGNSATATKATQDASGNVITTTYATKTELQQAKSELGSELNYEDSTLELLNSTGETLSSVTIKSTPDLDNKTINLNSNSQLQSVGSILQSGGYQKYWQGTKAEYEAIQVKDPDTLYEVLDDIVDIVTEIPTATLEDIGLCKPDGTTITIDDTGTLSVPSSFLLNHNSSNLAHVDVFNTKANVNLNNVSSRYDWITTRVIYNDGESGYELSRQGWIRQWGKVNSSANGEVEFTLHQPFKDMTYSIFAQVNELGNYFLSIYPSGNQKFKLRVQSSSGTNMAVRVAWRAYGFYE